MTPRMRELAQAIVDGSSRVDEAKELAGLVLAPNARACVLELARNMSPAARGELVDALAALHRCGSPGSLARDGST